MPREGAVVTVYYHDEAYGDKTDELTDSADAPGSLDLGEGEHASLTYGNEVFHVANVITDAEETIGAPSLPGGDGNKPSQPAPTTNNTTSSSATAPGAGDSGTPAAPTSGAGGSGSTTGGPGSGAPISNAGGSTPGAGGSGTPAAPASSAHTTTRSTTTTPATGSLA